jgi:hypothetical protein
MIGGALGNQAVVWIKSPSWSDQRVDSALKALTARIDAPFDTVALQLRRDSTGPKFANDFNLLGTDATANVESVEAIASHARPPQQVLVGNIGTTWSSLLDQLHQTARDINAEVAITGDVKRLSIDVKAIASAERRAGVTSQINTSVFG